MEYTKGPWEYNGNEIIAISNPKTGIGGFIKDEDNILAAAAPDMYEALKEIQECKGNPKMLEGIIIMRHIEQAIAKAEGRS